VIYIYIYIYIYIKIHIYETFSIVLNFLIPKILINYLLRDIYINQISIRITYHVHEYMQSIHVNKN